MPTQVQTQAGERRYDIDWLRIGAVYLLFFFHSAMVFNPAPFYHVRNAEVSTVMLVVAGFISLWHMPLFFLLAGWSVVSSLESRGRGTFFVLCTAALGPPIKYLELRGGLDMSTNGLAVSRELQPSFRSVIPTELPVAEPFHESFAEFLPTFFTSLDRFTWSHLFTFTLLYQPVFSYLRARAGRIETVSGAWVYAPIVPLALIQVVLRPYWPGVQNLYDDWANFAYYSTYLILGFLLACHPRLERVLHSEWRRALGVSVVALLVLLLGVLGVIRSPSLILAGTAVAGWCFVVALLGAANAWLQRPAKALDYLRESAFPVYILHQPAVVFVGAVVVELSLGIAAKLAVLTAVSLVATLLVYHCVVRHVPLLRLALGMKPLSAARSGAIDTPALVRR